MSSSWQRDAGRARGCWTAVAGSGAAWSTALRPCCGRVAICQGRRRMRMQTLLRRLRDASGVLHGCKAGGSVCRFGRCGRQRELRLTGRGECNCLASLRSQLESIDPTTKTGDVEKRCSQLVSAQGMRAAEYLTHGGRAAVASGAPEIVGRERSEASQ